MQNRMKNQWYDIAINVKLYSYHFSAAAGFPAGQTTLKTKLVEIEDCVALGADEIDIVISRNLVILGQWEELYNELRQIRKACGKIAMKTILATGELPSYDDIYKASMVAMMAGSDFIKTSTGGFINLKRK